MKSSLQLATRYFIEGIREKTIPRNKHHILLACMRRSGSTYVSSLLSNIGDFKAVNVGYIGSEREQEADREALVVNHRFNYVAQLHTKYHVPLSHLMDNYNLKPVVLIRDIHDIVISVSDYLMAPKNKMRTPGGGVPSELSQWDEEKRLLFAVQHIVPWSITFFLSWQKVPDKTLITFDEIIQTPVPALQKIFHDIDIPISNQDILHAIELSNNANTGKVVGISGRGKVLPVSVLDAIASYAEFYKNYDLSPIGIKNYY